MTDEHTAAIVTAAERLVRCKGRYHSEMNMIALAALFGVKLTPSEVAAPQALAPLSDEQISAMMALADAYAQDAKDFGHLDHSDARTALESALHAIEGAHGIGAEVAK
jgi:hypothetical protein